MNYNGYIIKFSDGKDLPLKYLQDISPMPNKTTDVDSYQDGDGELVRNVLPHKATKFELNTIPLNVSEWEEFISAFNFRYSDAGQRQIDLKFFDFEKCEYRDGKFYVPDWDMKITRMFDNDLIIDSVRLALIEY